MTTTAVLAAAANQPTEGWGKLLGLLIAAGLFWAGTAAHKRWQQTSSASSTEPAPAPSGGVKPQVSACSDPTFDPTQKRGPEEVGKRVTALDAWVKDRAGKAGYRATLRAGMAKFGKSEATVKRALRRAKTEGGQAS